MGMEIWDVFLAVSCFVAGIVFTLVIIRFLYILVNPRKHEEDDY